MTTALSHYPGLEISPWQPQFHAVLLETDPQKLQQCVFSVEEAIARRMESLADSPDAEAERNAIQKAVRALRAVQVERLNYPHWNKK